PTTMYPVYGLAEASLAVTFPDPGAPYHALPLNRHRLGVGARIEQAAPGTRDAVDLMGVGRPILHARLRIPDHEDRPLPPDTVGHIQISGDNVTRGYFEDPESNARSFSADGWLKTGDLGVLHQGELYVTGRDKEI